MCRFVRPAPLTTGYSGSMEPSFAPMVLREEHAPIARNELPLNQGLVRRLGLEPRTLGLKGRCSTN